MEVTFKENVSDIKNSKVSDLINQLMAYFIDVHMVDPWASPNELVHEYGITLIDEPIGQYDPLVLADGHEKYKIIDKKNLENLSKDSSIIFDFKGELTEDVSNIYQKF